MGPGRSLEGGCLFVAASTELDDREGRAPELVRQQKEWLGFLSTVAGSAVSEGHFRSSSIPSSSPTTSTA